MTAPVIRLSGAAVSYSGPAVISGVDLDVAAATVHVLLGESGSGKTTLLRALAGFEPLCAGSLELCGAVVDGGQGTPMPPEQRGVGVVFQDYALFPHLDVAGNLAFGQKRRDDGKIGDLLESVGLSGYAKSRVEALSGGEQQRVALARALAHAPRIILFDEPFSNLNRDLRRSLRRETVALLRKSEITSVFVTHDREEAFAIADTLSVLADGALLATGEPQALYADPIHAGVARALGDCAIVSGERQGDTIRCSLGEVSVRGSGSAIVVRPGDLRVGSGDLSAHVEHDELCGPMSRLILRIGDDELIAHAETGAHRAGDSVVVELTASELPAVAV